MAQSTRQSDGKAHVIGSDRPQGKRKKRRTGLWLIALFVMVICGLTSYKRVMLEREEIKVKAAYEAALNRYEGELEREEQLEELSIYAQTKKFIEDIAREKFGLVYENEIIFEPEE